ncbi:MAG: hypothetical protein E6J20_07250 [Chloroflexi bacterium]|nr:MAG: hypothetical protein E6J20_07250 [Chloroflexota bacterium]
MSDIERELEQELHRVLDPISDRRIPPRRSIQAHRTLKTLLGGAGAALAVKVLTGVAVAAAAATVAGVATTGSLNPATWGQRVEQQVSDCKSQLAAGAHGIGDCISPFANQHGSAVASAARQHGNGNGDGSTKTNGSSNGNGNANGHSGGNSGHGKDHPASPKSQSGDPEPIDPIGPNAPVKITPRP